MNKAEIDKQIQWLLQVAEEEPLVRAIWALTPEQKGSTVFKEIGQQRYLSALRSGGIDNVEMTKTVFRIDPYFLKSKLAMDAARRGYNIKVARGQFDIAKRIKEIMGLPDELPTTSSAPLAKNENAISIDTGKVPPLPPQGEKA